MRFSRSDATVLCAAERRGDATHASVFTAVNSSHLRRLIRVSDISGLIPFSGQRSRFSRGPSWPAELAAELPASLDGPADPDAEAAGKVEIEGPPSTFYVVPETEAIAVAVLNVEVAAPVGLVTNVARDPNAI